MFSLQVYAHTYTHTYTHPHTLYLSFRSPIIHGPMMSIPARQLNFHSKCLLCVVCRSPLTLGYGHTTVFLRHSLPHCASCYSTDNGQYKVEICYDNSGRLSLEKRKPHIPARIWTHVGSPDSSSGGNQAWGQLRVHWHFCLSPYKCTWGPMAGANPLEFV